MGTDYLVWSNYHRAWWRPRSAGYTVHVEAAGRYSRHEALSICRSAHDGWRPGQVPPEIPVREDDALFKPDGPQLSAAEARAIEDSFRNDREAHELLAIIVAEFTSDPMSVQCFDLRIVERAKLCATRRKAHEAKGGVFE